MARYGNISIWDNLKSKLRNGPMVIRLILLNVIVYIAFWLIYAIVRLAGIDSFLEPVNTGRGIEMVLKLKSWLTAPSDFTELIYRIWTPLTYQFLHADLLHIFMNMLLFYFLGRIFNEFLGDRKVLTTYLVGGIFGYLLFALGYNLIPVLAQTGNHTLLGASASVMAVVVGIATYMPNYSVQLILFGPVQLKWLAVIFVVLDVLSLGALDGAGTGLSHLGGAFWGWLVFSQMKKGRDLNAPFERIIYAVPSLFKRKPKIRVEYRKPGNSAPRQKTQARKQTSTRQTTSSNSASSADHQRRIDEILDKISKSGYDSLSKQEKEYLFKSSNRK